nr:hypothetical protein [uncultured Kingella sp.]
MIRCWLALTYYLYALRLAALSHFYFNRLYKTSALITPTLEIRQPEKRTNAFQAARFMRKGYCFFAPNAPFT